VDLVLEEKVDERDEVEQKEASKDELCSNGVLVCGVLRNVCFRVG